MLLCVSALHALAIHDSRDSSLRVSALRAAYDFEWPVRQWNTSGGWKRAGSPVTIEFWAVVGKSLFIRCSPFPIVSFVCFFVTNMTE
jgi:hypothetical protein